METKKTSRAERMQGIKDKHGLSNAKIAASMTGANGKPVTPQFVWQIVSGTRQAGFDVVERYLAAINALTGEHYGMSAIFDNPADNDEI